MDFGIVYDSFGWRVGGFVVYSVVVYCWFEKYYDDIEILYVVVWLVDNVMEKLMLLSNGLFIDVWVGVVK